MKKIMGMYLVILLNLYGNECKDSTTYGLMDCQKIEILNATKKMNHYFTTALERQDDKKLVHMMKNSQEQWRAYEKFECDAIYQQWVHGTIRELMSGSCSLEMIQQRTHNIWKRYLTYMDNSKPILTEP